MFGEKDLSTTEIYILKSFDDQLEDEEKIGCFAIIAINVLKMYCCYKWSLALPHCALGLVCSVWLLYFQIKLTCCLRKVRVSET